MRPETKENLHNAFKSLRERYAKGALKDYFVGICSLTISSTRLRGSIVEAAVAEFAADWPEYSGNPRYPVPDPIGFSPVQAYNGLPKWQGAYGEARARLLDHLIEKTK